jgi:hypothetical protein
MTPRARSSEFSSSCLLVTVVIYFLLLLLHLPLFCSFLQVIIILSQLVLQLQVHLLSTHTSHQLQVHCTFCIGTPIHFPIYKRHQQNVLPRGREVLRMPLPLLQAQRRHVCRRQPTRAHRAREDGPSRLPLQQALITTAKLQRLEFKSVLR